MLTPDLNKLAASIHEAIVLVRQLEHKDYYFHETISLALIKCHEAAAIVEGHIADNEINEQSEEFCLNRSQT